MTNELDARALLSARLEVHAQVRVWSQRVKLTAVAAFFVLMGVQAAGLVSVAFSPALVGTLFGLVLACTIFTMLSASAQSKLSRQFSQVSAETLVHESRNQTATP